MGQVKLIVSNWKMNLDGKQATRLINNLLKLEKSYPNFKNIVCPQFMLIPLVSKMLKKNNIFIGSQDCHFLNDGAYTGDTSLKLLKENNCKYVIVGHSERRQYHQETDSIVRKKVEHILSNNLKPIVCVGESLNKRKSKKYEDFLKKQLENCIPGNQNHIIIAYEPVWSIGTGLVPTFSEINEIYNLTKFFLKKTKNIKDFHFLYGGSVNSKNFKEILDNTHVDGALIGGSSLNFIEMKKILTNC